MIGNVWEWTASDFLPYPGFVAGPVQGVLRALVRHAQGAARRLLRDARRASLRNTCRNFYTPDRRDVWAGFRTCAA